MNSDEGVTSSETTKTSLPHLHLEPLVPEEEPGNGEFITGQFPAGPVQHGRTYDVALFYAMGRSNPVPPLLVRRYAIDGAMTDRTHDARNAPEQPTSLKDIARRYSSGSQTARDSLTPRSVTGKPSYLTRAAPDPPVAQALYQPHRSCTPDPAGPHCGGAHSRRRLVVEPNYVSLDQDRKHLARHKCSLYTKDRVVGHSASSVPETSHDYHSITSTASRQHYTQRAAMRSTTDRTQLKTGQCEAHVGPGAYTPRPPNRRAFITNSTSSFQSQTPRFSMQHRSDRHLADGRIKFDHKHAWKKGAIFAKGERGADVFVSSKAALTPGCTMYNVTRWPPQPPNSGPVYNAGFPFHKLAILDSE
ncbi:hypothetical protein CYMTET_48443 [Cymbomonas tetramitiformis]|uniref:Uncharacterized protein n=1 Tax=Cymbomonas tetramitiformis TaxID=36881 RepID=A0AAE0EVR2_9CHLO|nr:hypothetical protein CYMTET_48443 [Cymbomonas tetramitiformis]